MADYDASKDIIITKAVLQPVTKNPLQVDVRAYDGGPPKAQVMRRIQRKGKEDVLSKELGRLNKDDVTWLVGVLSDLEWK